MTSDHQCLWYDVEQFEVNIHTHRDYSVLNISTPGGYGRDESAIYLSPQQLDHLIYRAIRAKQIWTDRKEPIMIVKEKETKDV